MSNRLLMILSACASAVFPLAVATQALAGLAAQDTIVIADFENRTGDAVFDEVMTQALTIELGQSPYLNVLSDRAARDTLRRLGHPTSSKSFLTT